MGESAPVFYYNVNPQYTERATVRPSDRRLPTEHPDPSIDSTTQQKLDSQFPSATILVRQLEQGPPVRSSD